MANFSGVGLLQFRNRQMLNAKISSISVLVIKCLLSRMGWSILVWQDSIILLIHPVRAAESTLFRPVMARFFGLWLGRPTTRFLRLAPVCLWPRLWMGISLHMQPMMAQWSGNLPDVFLVFLPITTAIMPDMHCF